MDITHPASTPHLSKIFLDTRCRALCTHTPFARSIITVVELSKYIIRPIVLYHRVELYSPHLPLLWNTVYITVYTYCGGNGKCLFAAEGDKVIEFHNTVVPPLRASAMVLPWGGGHVTTSDTIACCTLEVAAHSSEVNTGARFRREG